MNMLGFVLLALMLAVLAAIDYCIFLIMPFSTALAACLIVDGVALATVRNVGRG